MPALPGCVSVRCIGAAVFGAVLVAGGAENVAHPAAAAGEATTGARIRIGGNKHKRGCNRGNGDQKAMA